MHEQDWQEPLTLDWAGTNGPPLTREDFYNSEISRILRNDFHAPFEKIEYVRQKPWWDPQDPYGNKRRRKFAPYIPGLQQMPRHPKLSTLNKLQHLSGLRVLSTDYRVQPWNYPPPTQDDFESFEKIKELYEKERRDYRLWAKMRWVHEDCIRILNPKPWLETVYEAEFELKKNEIHTLPHNFTISGQISLRTRKDTFELKHIKDLKSVDVKSLPVVDYPDVLDKAISLLQPYTIPKPCNYHSTRFVLPYDTSITVLPLPELHKELANYSIANGAECIASEKALQCLIETERSWMLPLSVVEVISTDGESVKTVLVLGSEFHVKKEYGAVISLKAYRHMLRNTFIKSPETTNTNSPTHQLASTNHPDPTSSSDNDDEQLTIDDIQQRQPPTEILQVSNVTNESRGIRDVEMPSCSSKPNRLTEDWSKPGCSTETKSSAQEKPRTNKTDKASRNQRNTFTKSTVTTNTNSPNSQNPSLTGRCTHQSTSRKLIKDLFYSKEEGETSSSDNEQLTIDEQRQRSTESPQVSNVRNKRHGTPDVEMPSCSSKPNRGTIDWPSPGCSSTETKFEPEVTVPVEHVPQEVPKQINYAGVYMEIDDPRASDQISLDVSSLSAEAINDIIGVNPITTETMDDIICDVNCTCEGTTYEVPPPRSFKKWRVNGVNDTSNRSFDLIIHSSHKVREGDREVILEPIVEWQPELGACKQSAGRLRALVLSLMMRPNAKLINVRVHYGNGNIILIDKLDEKKFISWHGDKRSEIADRIHTVIDQLRLLKQGQYVLAHDPCHGANAMVYSPLSRTGFPDSGKDTLSLRPKSVCMSFTDEAILLKIAPELSRAMLPYHKAQGILPLAFTTEKKQVRENKKVNAAFAKARQPNGNQPGAGGSSRRKRKRKKKIQQWPENTN